MGAYLDAVAALDAAPADDGGAAVLHPENEPGTDGGAFSAADALVHIKFYH